MNNTVAVVIAAIIGLAILLLVFKGVGFIVDHPFLSLSIAAIVAVIGSYLSGNPK